jgi:hypothetical protein
MRAIPVFLSAFLCASAALAGAPVVVTSGMGGAILGYDVDSGGTEGLLSEYVPDGSANDVAVETFDLRTGAILKFVKKKKNTRNDFVVLGVAGAGAGLVETEIVGDLFVDKRQYNSIAPLGAARFTGKWTPKLGGPKDIITAVSTGTGSSVTAIMGFTNKSNTRTFLFTTDVAGNAFGKTVFVKDPLYDFNDSPVMTYDGAANLAILGASRGCPSCLGEVTTVDMATGTELNLGGVGLGFINGIAADEADGIVCTTTEIDFSVEFVDLATHKVLRETLPNAQSQANSGSGVAYDPVAKLFFVGQPISSTGASSSVQIYDNTGAFVKSVNNLHLPSSAVRIALSPTLRRAFVQSTDEKVLQTFDY